MPNEFSNSDDHTVANQRPVTDESTHKHVWRSPPTQPRIPQVTQASIPTPANPTYHPPIGTYSPPVEPPPLIRESAARERMRRRRVHSRRKGGDWAWVIIAAALFGIVVIISMSLFLALRVSQSEQEIIPTAAAVLPTPVDARQDFNAPNGNFATGQQVTLADGRNIVLEPWDGRSRFTILVMGLDRRPGETGLAYRTDTMLLVSIDPASNSVGMLSIPRDLFVPVPGYGQLQRVNTPMVLGELQQPGFGPQLAMQTVQYNLGMHVHDYLAVDFNTFVTLVDTVGGIDLNVPRTINDPLYPNMFYGYDPFFIAAGQHHLDGVTALKYARTRHDSNDFERAQRQQQVLYSVRDRILDFNMLPQLIIQAPRLWSSLNDNISTGLNLDQVIQLGWYLKDIPDENIHTGVIDSQYTYNYTTPAGAAVLVPDRSRLGPLMVDVFGASYSN